MKQHRFSQAPDYVKLGALALQLRRDTLRMIRNAGSGHIGGSLGLADYMSALYGYAMEYDTEDLVNPDRDRIILSNGHTCAVWYAALARCGFIPLKELATFRKLGSRLQGHPARKTMPELVETSTGPLGQGFSVANGIAMSMKLRKSDGQVYCIIGDGEVEEGQVWEAFMTAAHYGLSNLTLFINDNKLQIDGPVKEIMNISSIAEHLKTFGWNVTEIDGHNMSDITCALKKGREKKEKPTAIIGNTLMGKGIPFMENLAEWHGTCPSDSQTAAGLQAIGATDIFEDFPLGSGFPE